MNSSGRFHVLPAVRTALIGRERDLAAVRAIFARPETRLVTLSGVGGCGKTRLAFHLAGELSADYRERVWAVELAAIRDRELIPIVLAEALGLPESSSPSSMVELVTFLRALPSLLLLDNCEHLVDDCAVVVDALLTSCPDLRVIVTSREPLHIPGERQYRVPPLDFPHIQDIGDINLIEASSAVQLFVTRARAVLPDFELTPNNAAGIVRICARLDGIPLALELAAARVHMLGVEEILERLDDAFQLLTGGSRVAPTRHQTLHAALAWSDALLTADERVVFRRLSVFAGVFQLEAAEAICADAEFASEAVFNSLSGLVDKSLVITESGEQVAWYRLLEPVRQYALELLDACHEAEPIRLRHASYYLNLAERAAAGLRGPEQMHWLQRLDRERANLRAALGATRVAEPLLELRLAVALAPFWEIDGHQREGLRQLRDALEHNEESNDLALRMRALGSVGRLALYVDHSTVNLGAEADSFCRESLSLARKLGDERAVASALIDLGRFHRMQREDARASAYLDEAMTICHALDDEPEALRVQLHLGLAISHLERTSDARIKAATMFQDSMERLQAIGDLRFAGIAQVLLGQASRELGDLGPAVRTIAGGISTHLHLNEQGLIVLDMVTLSEVLLDGGQAQHAVRFAGATQSLLERLGSAVDRTPFTNIADVRKRVAALRCEAWFEAAWSEGFAWKTKDATLAAHALAETLEVASQSVVPEAQAHESLTPRELEVARLLAESYSDRQIADALFIAPSTVSTHVHHILQKLDLRSRVQVADWLTTQAEHSNEPA